MAHLGVAIIISCSYNMLGMRMYQIKQFLEVHPKKLKTQHHLATSRSQMSDVHGRQATIPNGKHYSHGEQNNIPGERIPLYQATNEQRHGHTN